MTPSRSNCTSRRMQLVAVYYVLIATYLIAGNSTAAAATEAAAVQRLTVRQKDPHQQQQQQQQTHLHKDVRSSAEHKQTRKFDFEPIIHNHPDREPNSEPNDANLAHMVFQPSILDFGDMPTGKPNSRVVTIINRHPNQSLTLISISGLAADFYSSFFDEQVMI